jgi:acetolactate synthase-1/2/3 large subunit
LQTVVYNNLPIKLFVWNNNGYLSIRTTQTKFFEGRFIGTDEQCGISFPEVKKIADAYGIPYSKAASLVELDKLLPQALTVEGPVLFEVIAPPDQPIIPAVSSGKRADGTMISKPLEDMAPFLDRNEFRREMIVQPVKE